MTQTVPWMKITEHFILSWWLILTQQSALGFFNPGWVGCLQSLCWVMARESKLWVWQLLGWMHKAAGKEKKIPLHLLLLTEGPRGATKNWRRLWYDDRAVWCSQQASNPNSALKKKDKNPKSDSLLQGWCSARNCSLLEGLQLQGWETVKQTVGQS